MENPDPPGVVLCPRCRYDTYGRSLPSNCPECGLSITPELLDGLTVWEREPATHPIIRCLRMLGETLLRPRRHYRKLSHRPQVPIFHSTGLALTYAVVLGAITVVDATCWVGCRIAICIWADPTAMDWVKWEMRWSGLALLAAAEFPLLAILGLWIVAAATLGATIGDRVALLQFRSSLALLGPLMVLCLIPACILRVAEDVVPIEKRVTPSYGAFENAVSLPCFALLVVHIGWIAVVAWRGRSTAERHD